MKKQNLKSLNLKKELISKISDQLNGGLPPTTGTTTSVTTYSIEYSNCDFCPVSDAPGDDISQFFPGNC